MEARTPEVGGHGAKPRSLSVFSMRSRPRGPKGSAVTRKLSLQDLGEGSSPEAPRPQGGHRRAASAGAHFFWKVLEAGGRGKGEGGKGMAQGGQEEGVKVEKGKGRWRGEGGKVEGKGRAHGGQKGIKGESGKEEQRDNGGKDVGVKESQRGESKEKGRAVGGNNQVRGEASGQQDGALSPPRRPWSVLQKIQSFEEMVRRRCSWKEEARCLPSASEIGFSDTAGSLGPGPASGSDSGTGSSSGRGSDSGSVAGLGPGGGQHSRHSEGLKELGSPLPLSEGESQDTTASLGPTASSPLSGSPQCEVVISPFHSSDDEGSLSDSSAVNSNSDVVTLDKSFSISLAELRDCGIELREDGQKGEHWNHSASLRSNLSLMSVVSLIPNDELERLLSEVKGLEEESIQCPEDVRVVVLHKDEGAGLGFSIAGGLDHTNRMVTVHKVFPNGLAAQEGTIERGDEVLSINGNLLKDISHREALSYLHKVRPSKQAIVVIRKVPESERAALHSGGVCSQMPLASSDVPESLGEFITVELVKTSTGLGFSLDGGKSSSQGDRPLTIKKVFQGGASDQSGLIQPGDQLVQVCDHDYQGLTCYEAWNLIKALPPGPVKVVICKKTL